MKYKIFQINSGRDSKDVLYFSYEKTLEFSKSQLIDSAIYDLVYEGEDDFKNLDEIFYRFNMNRPSDYKYRSLSISDVIEICSEKSKFYFVDDYGFKEIDFDTGKCGNRE